MQFVKVVQANGRVIRGFRCDGGYHIHRTRKAAARCEAKRKGGK
jgi:hypothetical protein